jgi:hypothetical protein
MVCHRTNPYASLFISYCFCSWFFTDRLLCFFVYLLLFLFMVSHRTNSMLLCLSFIVFVHGFSHRIDFYASLFTSCCVCSWFFSQNQLLCFFLYLVFFVHGFSLLGTDHTNCAWQSTRFMVSAMKMMKPPVLGMLSHTHEHSKAPCKGRW